MRRKRSLGIALACLLALSVAACGNDGGSQGSDTAKGKENSSSTGAEENGGQSETYEPAKKDEPTLDWSAVSTAPEEDFFFTTKTLNGVKGMVIKEYQGEGGVVKIPASYQDLPVILIDQNAFKGTNVTDVYFETESFVYIQPWAFEDCTSLNSIVIRGNEESQIRDSAFKGCTGLTSIVLSEGITHFGESSSPFKDTPWLENKKQENPLVIVNNTVLDGKSCTGDVVVPDGVIRIAPGAFSGNENITSVTLPDSIWRIETHAFARCTSLTSVNIPDDTVSMGGAMSYAGSEKVVLTYQGKKYTYEELQELDELFYNKN